MLFSTSHRAWTCLISPVLPSSSTTFLWGFIIDFKNGDESRIQKVKHQSETGNQSRVTLQHLQIRAQVTWGHQPISISAECLIKFMQHRIEFLCPSLTPNCIVRNRKREMAMGCYSLVGRVSCTDSTGIGI